MIFGGFPKIIPALVLGMFVTAAATAAAPFMGKPAKPFIEIGKNTMGEAVLNVIFAVPPEIAAFEEEAAGQTGAPNLVIEYDVRVDGGKWLMDRKTGAEREAGLQAYYIGTLKNNFLAYDFSQRIIEGAKKIDSGFESWMFGFGDEWDLKNHSYSFRYRFVYEQLLPDHGGKPGYKERATEWSDEASAGKMGSVKF
jgi:hypothetical protein